jgi:hypothetical protein
VREDFDGCNEAVPDGWVGSADFLARWQPRPRVLYSEYIPRRAMIEASVQVRACLRNVCKTVGSAYVGSNPTPATRCEDAPLAANSLAGGAFLLCPVVCRLVAL